MPVEVVRAIFEATARADPDAMLLLTMTCEAWKRLAIETSQSWGNIRVDLDRDGVLEVLHLSLLLSKNWPLDIAITGVRASDEIINSLTPHVHRIRTLELFLYREARVPFRVLGGTPPDGLSSLSRLAIGSPSYDENSSVPSKHPLKRANRVQNTINETDLYLIRYLPSLSSLNALVFHAPGIANVFQLQLPRVESLRLVMKDTPMVLENLTCDNLKNLDIVLDDTSREGWWDLLTQSLTYPRLESLALDVTLDRVKNEWSKPWDSRKLRRLIPQPTIRCVTVALSFSDREYLSAEIHEANVEYLCGDLLHELIESVPSMKELRLLHVPYLHAPFIWPTPEVLSNLQRLELQVPAVVWDEYIPVIELPKLRDLRYYGDVSEMTQLPRLRTPFLEYLEIMHHGGARHPTLLVVDRYWPFMLRASISHERYSKSRENTSKDFPTKESLPNRQGPNLYLPVVSQSVALRELRLSLQDTVHIPLLKRTVFPQLRALHCTVFIFTYINAPKLAELYLLHVRLEYEEKYTKALSEERAKTMLHGLTILDMYSHSDPRPDGAWYLADMKFRDWMPCLHSLRTLILGLGFVKINDVIEWLWSDPMLCPKLTTIDSFDYPNRWTSLRECIEKRNHLAMQDPSVQPIHTLRFPVALHRNISDRLKESLSGEFAGRFVGVPLPPRDSPEPSESDDEVDLDERPYGFTMGCFGCVRSGTVARCLSPKRQSSSSWNCDRHMNHGADRGVTITAYNMQLAGYLEGA